MILISYDIHNDKLRTQFSKYIKKYGYRVQYSVFEITHSKTMLNNIRNEIANKFEKRFTEVDSVIVIETSESCKISRFGYAKNEENDIIIVG